jgi:hypothetical protein
MNGFRFSRSQIICVAIIAITSIPFVIAGCLRENVWIAKSGPDSVTEKQIEAIENAKHSIDAKAAYKNLFDKKRAAQVRDLKDNPNLGIALRAAWEEVVRTVPTKDWRPPYTVDGQALQDFVGFAELRLGVTVPAWWKETILNAQANRRSNIYFENGFRLYPNETNDLRTPDTTTLVSRDDAVVMTVNGESMVIPKEVFGDDVRLCGFMDASIDRDRAYIAFHSDVPGPYPLTCVDRTSGKTLWKSKVWCISGFIFYSGAGFWHAVSIATSEQRVLVFGVANNLAYIEGFNATNGDALFRFSTP